MSAETEGYTLGVEEECQIVDAGTRELASRGERVLRRTQQSLGERVAPEMFASQVEAMTRVCRTLAEVRAELLRLRRAVIEAAEGEGARIAAASTHPFSHWQEQPITPKERYRRLAEREQQLAEEQVVFGFHVHVGLSDREVAVQVLNRARVAGTDASALGQLSLLARRGHRLRQLPHAGLGQVTGVGAAGALFFARRARRSHKDLGDDRRRARCRQRLLGHKVAGEGPDHRV